MHDDEGKAASQPDLDRTLYNLSPGLLLDGRYRLRRFLGRGGFGEVWLAQDEELRMEVAVKLLSELVVASPEAVEDLKLETKNSLRLTHPNIVRIHGFFQTPQAAGIVMEYVDGGTLSALKARREPRCFDPPDLRSWLLDLCEALEYAHRRVRIVHRDLKPGNLMVNARGEIKIADFGIARTISDTYSKLSNRPTSGTLAYMSPQQLMGQAAKVTDDIYSLGATIYDLLAGKPPFYTGDVPAQIRMVDPMSMTDRRRELDIETAPIPPAWEETIASCLSKDPALRPQSAAELSELLKLRHVSGDTPSLESWGRAVHPAGSGDPSGSLGPTAAISGGSGNSAAPVSGRSGSGASVPEASASGPAPWSRPGTVEAGPGTDRARSVTEERKRSRTLPWLVAGALAVVVAGGGVLLFHRAPPPPGEPPARSRALDQAEPAQQEDGSVEQHLRPGARPPVEAGGAAPVPGSPPPVVSPPKVREDAAGRERVPRPSAPPTVVDAVPPSSAASAPSQGASAAPARGKAPVLAPASQAAEESRASSPPAGSRTADETRTSEPAPASQPPGDEEMIRDVIRSYKQAFEQLDVDLYERIRPSLSASDREKLRASFRDLKEQSLSLGEPSIQVNGRQATASFREKRELLLKAGKDHEVDHAVRMILAKNGEGWTIQEIEYH